MSELLNVLVVLALVGANAFFVIGEYAVVTARRGALSARAEAGSAGARAALRLMDDPVRVISTVQVGITALGILVGAIGEPLVRELLGDWLPQWARFGVAFLTVTYLSVVLGELVPKALTLDRADRLAALVAPPVELMAALLRPVVWVLERSAGLLLRPFGIREVVAGEGIRSPEELRQLVDEAEEGGIIPTAQEELLHNVLQFADLEVGDVMVPVAEVDWLGADLVAETALREVLDHPHSRYPVGRDSLDHVLGVVHVRDLLEAAHHQTEQTVAELAQTCPIVPETKDVGALLRDLREQRRHMAAVVDEYGRTLGIVTLEDVLEELVGEIDDEYDLPDSSVERLDEQTVRIAGSMTVDDFNESLGTALPQDGPRTMAGLVYEALGRAPEEGEACEVGGAQLAVEELDGARITRMRVRLPGEAA